MEKNCISFADVEAARQKFMRGEISAESYWRIRVAYYSQFVTKSKKV